MQANSNVLLLLGGEVEQENRDQSLRLPMICLGAGHFATRALPQHGSPVCVVFSVKWHEHVQTP
jgi:hypothetical protein